MTVVLFEDRATTQLHPVALGRPAFAISCGGARLIDQALSLGLPVTALVRPHLRDLLSADYPQLSLQNGRAVGPLLLVNARMVPSAYARRELARLWKEGQTGVVKTDSQIAAALLRADERLLASLPQQPVEEQLAGLELPELEATLPLFSWPHDIIRHHLTTFDENLSERIYRGELTEIADGVLVAGGAKLGQHVVTDTKTGPIVIEAGASIGHFAFLKGPVHVGQAARVLEHAALKDCVSIGHTTKIGGEVEASIIEPYTNKQHHGFLGHSYLGSWINLGAGTCNSDLKNTYGQVNMRYGERKVPTGMQFVGAMVGDYAKTAINTGIFTGKAIGVCSMVYGFVTTNVPSFVNYARTFGQVTAAPVEVMVATQARMFARRNVEQRPCDIQLLQDMFDLTRPERELGSMPHEPLSL